LTHLHIGSIRSIGARILSNCPFVMALIAALMSGSALADSTPPGPRFEVSFPASAHPQPITGRLFLMISRVGEPEVRLQSTWLNSPEMVGVDVSRLNPDQFVAVDGTALGTPLHSLDEVPLGDYYVQAVMSVYTEFHRADGHVIWTHADQGEGQQFNTSPGNLYSSVQRVHLDRGSHINLRLSEVIPSLPAPVDTAWVKHLRIQSKLLSRFWGRPIYLGAVVLLPRDYAAHPDRQYPVIYAQPEHSRKDPPFEFATVPPRDAEADRRQRAINGYESGYEFYQSWQSDHFPRVIAVSFLTPTPFADWSGAVDSANNGPYGNAIMTELIPAIEERFRVLRRPYGRVLTGRASGGRAALTLQLLHPESFGGIWVFRPWPFDFRLYFGLDVYQNENAFRLKATDLPSFGRNPSQWSPVERGYARTTTGSSFVTLQQASQHDAVMVGMAGGDPIGADDAILGPVGENGRPKPLWDRTTGAIDHSVAEYWREHSDLVQYTESHWSTIGRLLVGKLHFYVDDLDEFYRNYGVHDLEAVLKTTQNPHYLGAFSYSYGISHEGGWQPMTNADLVELMAGHVAENAPKNADMAWKND
jgi:Putative esterase